MRRVRVSWDGGSNLPGLSTFYYAASGPNVGDLVSLFTAMKFTVPLGITWTIPATGDEIDSATGTLTGTWTGSGGGTVASAGGAAAYAMGTGLIFNWGTGTVHNGRRVKGRTFFVPQLASSYDVNGLITSTVRTATQTALNAFIASAEQKGIWSRGRNPSDGVFAPITSATIPNRVTSLRSRRS